MLVGKNYKVIVAHFAHTAQANDSSAEMQGRAKNVHKKLTGYRFLHTCICYGILPLKYPKSPLSSREMKLQYQM